MSAQANGSSGSGSDRGLTVLTDVEVMFAYRLPMHLTVDGLHQLIPSISSFFVDPIPNQVQAELTLTCPQQTGQQVGSVGRDLEARPGVWLGWLGSLAGLRCSPQLTPMAQGRGHWQGNLWSHNPAKPHIPQIIIMGRSTAHGSVTKCPVASSQSPKRHSVTASSALSLLLAAKLLVYCQIPTALPPLTSVLVAVFRNQSNPPVPSLFNGFL